MKINNRTSIDHDNIVTKIINNPDSSPLMGIVRQSPVHGLIGFHPITSLPADVMHDFIEGICPAIIMALLKQASAMRLITYGKI